MFGFFYYGGVQWLVCLASGPSALCLGPKDRQGSKAASSQRLREVEQRVNPTPTPHDKHVAGTVKYCNCEIALALALVRIKLWQHKQN